MTSERAFLDTNVLIYAFTQDARADAAEALLAQGCDISVQVLNEFANVARRKLDFDWAQLGEALEAIASLCNAVHPLDLATHKEAMRLAECYGFWVFDALIVASALRAGCSLIYSEDMHDGLIVDGGLTIINPFGRP